MTGLISIIVTTYNREDALDAVLHSLSRQGDRRFEVVIADDGSRPETAALIQHWQPMLGVKLAHIWHEKNGFRAAESRNRAIRASAGEYCVFLDGDCLAATDFVAEHRRLAERGWFVTGSRVLLSRSTTEDVLDKRVAPVRWGPVAATRHWLRRDINRISPLLRLPVGPLRRLRSRAWRGARSCNLAVWRSDLDRVDGFDAAFNGWGREDSDLLVRLLRSGVRRKDGIFATGVFHLWHPEADRSSLPENDGRLAQVIADDRIRASRGLSSIEGAD